MNNLKTEMHIKYIYIKRRNCLAVNEVVLLVQVRFDKGNNSVKMEFLFNLTDFFCFSFFY